MTENTLDHNNTIIIVLRVFFNFFYYRLILCML